MSKPALWIKRVILALTALVVLLLIVGFTYEHMSRFIYSQKIKPTGEFVNVGNHQLHYLKKGDGGPTVVFEAGLDIRGHLPWKHVQDEISRYTTTISYDRAGILWSERGDNPKSLTTISTDLYNLLRNTDCPKPYILVGHSFAGITLRKFIEEHKSDVSGVIFVDVSHPDYMNRVSDEIKKFFKNPPFWISKAMSSLGIDRIMVRKYFPREFRNDLKLMHKGFDAAFEESQNFESINLEASGISTFGNMPLIIISGVSDKDLDVIKDEKIRTEWMVIHNELQKDLLQLSSDSQHILATESGHNVQLDQPEIVIKAIESMLKKNLTFNE